MYKILFADDEPQLRGTTRDFLTARGFDVTLAADGAEALALLCETRFDLIVLDVMMPVMDGFAVLRELRDHTDAPVILLSALGREADQLRGFRLGADDYIAKPYPLSLLCEKCTALLRLRERQQAEESITVGAIRVLPAARRVEVNGVPVALADKDFRLLLTLVRNRGAVLTREQLINRVWGAGFDGDARVVDTHVKLLRRKLGPAAPQLRTVVGAGYALDG